MGWTVGNSNLGRGKKFQSSPKHPDWLWGTPSLLLTCYRHSYFGRQAAGIEALTST
jgi:hypothetical protein